MDVYLFLIAISLVLFFCSFVLHHVNPTSLFTGLAILLFILSVGLIFFATLLNHFEHFTFWLIVPIAIFFLIIAVFWLFILVIMVFVNTRAVLKRERFSIGNLLPLFSLIGFVVLELILFLLQHYYGDVRVVKMMLVFIHSTISYIILLFSLYTFTAIYYKWMPTFKKIDYILILGSGLIKDQVTPLLAGRIDAGMQFFKKQKVKPTIIVCGGKGADENISEAEAMKKYIVENYESDLPIYLENQSTTTEENIQFAEKVVQEQDQRDLKKANVAIATSTYHLLRAGKLAQQLGIRAFGIGGKTKLYYIPTAFIREFIGYIVLKKRTNILIVSFLLLFAIISNLF